MAKPTKKRGTPIRLYLYAIVFGVAAQMASLVLDNPLRPRFEELTGLHFGTFDRTEDPVRWLTAMPEFWLGFIAVILLYLIILRPIGSLFRRTQSPAEQPLASEPLAPDSQLEDLRDTAKVQPRRVSARRPSSEPATKAPDSAVTASVAPAAEDSVDVDLLYRAALRAAGATGGISPPELLMEFEDLTGLTAPAWAHAVRDIRANAEGANDLAIFEKLTSPLDRRIVMALVLKIGSLDGQLPPRTKALVDQMASRMNLSSEDVSELFADMTAAEGEAAA